ncbi:MAG: hypothetical protein ACI9UV_002694, partial [Algoriphagus sp.]
SSDRHKGIRLTEMAKRKENFLWKFLAKSQAFAQEDVWNF